MNNDLRVGYGLYSQPRVERLVVCPGCGEWTWKAVELDWYCCSWCREEKHHPDEGKEP